MAATPDLTLRTVPNLLRSAAQKKPNTPFLHFKGESWTFDQVDKKANQFAGFLNALGVTAGDKVGIFLQNSPEWIFAWLGCAKANVLYVPINTEYKGDILIHQLTKAEVSTVVISDAFVERIAHIRENLPTLRTIIVVGNQTDNVVVKDIVHVPYNEMDAFSQTDPDIEVFYFDPHAIAFTSGTTGPSKGALAPHGHAVTFAFDTVRAMGLQEGEKIYNSGMPLFHSLATWMGVLPALITCSEYMLVERFSASQFWPDVHSFGATVALGVFTLPPILMKQPAKSEDGRVPLKRFIVTQHNAEFEKRYNGCRLLNTYGQTETGCVSLTPYGEESRPGSCGKINDNTFEVKIVDDHDNECRTSEVGEIVVRPRYPYVMMSEYYNMPRETNLAFKNLWFHTGDSGKLDKDGYLYFVDRKKDAMRRRGENISSYEIESVINRHPKILECAVIALPSPFGEDDLKAVVIPKSDETITHEELWVYFEQNMPRFWVPRYIEIRSELPKTPNQKILKYFLRDQGAVGELKDREQVFSNIGG